MNAKEQVNNDELRDKLVSYLLEKNAPVWDTDFEEHFKISKNEVHKLLSRYKIASHEYPDVPNSIILKSDTDELDSRFSPVITQVELEKLLVTDELFMHPIPLNNFLFKEICFILDEGEVAIAKSQIIEKAEKSFINYYGLPSVGKTNPYGLEILGVFPETINNIILKNYEIFYINVNMSKSGEDKIGLRKWKNSIIGETYSRFEYAVLNVFRKKQTSELEVKDLDFRLNRLRFSFDVPKPISEEYVMQMIEAGSEIFTYDKEKRNLILKSDMARIKGKLFEQTFSVAEVENYLVDSNSGASGKEFSMDRIEVDSRIFINASHFVRDVDNMSFPDASGVAAFHYSGENFPLEGAKEYVRLRPIVYLLNMHANENLFKSILNYDKPAGSEFLQGLKAILPPQTDLKEWVAANISVSFYLEYLENWKESEYLHKLCIAELSPVLNLKNNLGNLFRITLENKIAALKKKV